MKKKMFKAATVLTAMCIMFVVCVSPVSAVEHAHTGDYYIFGDKCYGTLEMYPDRACATTHYDYLPGGKRVDKIQFSYLTPNGDTVSQFDYGSYIYGGGTTIASLSIIPNVTISYCLFAGSKHSVRMTSDPKYVYGWSSNGTEDNPQIGINPTPNLF